MPKAVKSECSHKWEVVKIKKNLPEGWTGDGPAVTLKCNKCGKKIICAPLWERDALTF